MTSNNSIRACIKALSENSGPIEELELVAEAFKEILSGTATPSQISAFLLCLRFRGHTPSLVATCSKVMHSYAVPVEIIGNGSSSFVQDVVDIVGTGGDGLDTFNVSTTAGIVAAACGLKVAKHGNRAASSLCGAADIIEACGANLEISAKSVSSIIESCGFCFLFSQKYHPAMRHVATIRKEIGTRTIFNLLGPMSNPARPRALVVGVFSPSIGRLMAEALAIKGVPNALVVHGLEGLDEISPEGPTAVWHLRDGKIEERTITPADFNLPSHPLTSVRGATAKENAATLLELFNGKEGPILDFVSMNAAALLFVAGSVPDFAMGVIKAKEAISSGKALKTLQKFIEVSHL